MLLKLFNFLKKTCNYLKLIRAEDLTTKVTQKSFLSNEKQNKNSTLCNNLKVSVLSLAPWAAQQQIRLFKFVAVLPKCMANTTNVAANDSYTNNTLQNNEDYYSNKNTLERFSHAENTTLL